MSGLADNAALSIAPASTDLGAVGGTIDPVDVVDPETVPEADRAADDRPVPFLALAAVVVLLVPLRAAVGPIRDIDLYWHLLVGQDILAGTGVAGAARGWSFAPVPDTWVSTQWLAEILFARLEQWGGLHALLYYRVVMMLGALAVLAAVTLVRRPPRASVWVFAIGALALSLTSQERSQQLTFLLAPLVGWWMERLWREGRLPRWWVALPLVVVWANVHGGWVILPMGLSIAALARVVDHGLRDRVAWWALLLAGGTVLAACASPSGIDNVLAAPRFAAAAGLVVEWGPVALRDWSALPLVLLLPLVVVAWARGRARPSRGELALVLLLLVFAVTAWRNLAPAVLMLAPVVVGILARALGEPDPTTSPLPLRRVVIAAGAAGAVLSLGLVALLPQPVVDASVPRDLIARIADSPAPQRVLNTYDLSGPLLWFGGHPPHVLVAIDGRADRYGAHYIGRYADTLAAVEGWQQMVDELTPTAALLRVDEALGGVLVAQRGWVEVAREGQYVLLHAPGAPGWS